MQIFLFIMSYTPLFLKVDCQMYIPNLLSDLTATQLQAIFQRALGMGSGLYRYTFLNAFLIMIVAFLAL